MTEDYRRELSEAIAATDFAIDASDAGEYCRSDETLRLRHAAVRLCDALTQQQSATEASLALLKEGLRPGDVVRLSTGEEWGFYKSRGSYPDYFKDPSGVTFFVEGVRSLFNAAIKGGQAVIVRTEEGGE